MTEPISIFTLDAACIYGDEAQVVHISNLVHSTQRITFTMLPNGNFVRIGDRLVVVGSSDAQLDKLLWVAYLAYQLDPAFSYMTVAQIDEFASLDYFAFLDSDRQLKTVQIKSFSDRKYPQLTGAKHSIARLLGALLSRQKILVRTNSSVLFQDALFADDLCLQRVVCLSFQPIDGCAHAYIVFQEAPSSMANPSGQDQQSEASPGSQGFDAVFQVCCDELNCAVDGRTDFSLAQILEPVKADFAAYLDYLELESAADARLQVYFPGFQRKNALYEAFIEEMRRQWQALLELEIRGISTVAPGTKRPAADIFQSKCKAFKAAVRRRMKEIGVVRLGTSPPRFVETFMGERLDLWVHLLRRRDEGSSIYK